MKVYEAMARAFADEGTEHLFSLMGDANMYWMSSLLSSGEVDNVHARHENAAVAMADGYARSTGKVGVATVTSGPGLAHAMTAIVGAARYRTPLVLFAGDTMRGDTQALQYIDHQAFASLCGVHCELVLSPEQSLDAVRRAFHRARTMRETVILSVPMDIQDRDYPQDYAYAPAAKGRSAAEAFVPDEDSVDEALGLLASARRPVIIVGVGALQGDALDAVERLGERVGALFATTLLAKGALDTSPWAIGISGTFSTPQAEKVLGEADLVVGIGASLNRFTRQEGYLFPQARTIQISHQREAETGGGGAVTAFLCGDARRTTELLERRLAEEEISSPGWRSRFTREPWDPMSVVEAGRVPEGEDALDPREAVAALEEHIPAGAIVVSGAGHFWSFVNKGLSGKDGRTFLYCLGFGSIGQALPVAVGAAVGNPDRPVVVVDGDSSILMYIAELDTAVRRQVNLLAFVLDDDAMGAELHKLRLRQVPDEAAMVATPGLDVVARGLGGEGAVVRDSEALHGALSAWAGTGVHLVDAKVSTSVVDVSSVMGNEVRSV
jgi:acetolactate synthase I/II/III large subunit